jgi:hypothetical protein
MKREKWKVGKRKIATKRHKEGWGNSKFERRNSKTGESDISDDSDGSEKRARISEGRSEISKRGR